MEIGADHPQHFGNCQEAEGQKYSSHRSPQFGGRRGRDKAIQQVWLAVHIAPIGPDDASMSIESPSRPQVH
jgi:hypothetical protein